MKKIFIHFSLAIMLFACVDEAPNIFEDLSIKGGFVLFDTDLNPLHDILGDDTVVDINIIDPGNNVISYSVAIEKEDGSLTEVIATIPSIPGNLVIKRQNVLDALDLNDVEDLPPTVKFIGIVETANGVISGQSSNFNVNTNKHEGGDTIYDGLASYPRQAMRFSMVMFQLISPDQVASFFIMEENDDVEEVVVVDVNPDPGIVVGSMLLDSGDLELGEISTDEGIVNIGLRFNFIGLPKGANITSAIIQFQVDNTGSDPVEMTIYGENSGNSVPFQESNSNLSDRALTNASVVWNIPAWVNEGDRGPAQASVDCSSVIEEIVNRSDWVPGNSIAIIMKPTGVSLTATSNSGGREAEAGPGSDSAELILSYTN